jgi:hypothetical protein
MHGKRRISVSQDNDPSEEIRRCNFCLKKQCQVRVLLNAIGSAAFICDECVSICVDRVREEFAPNFCPPTSVGLKLCLEEAAKTIMEGGLEDG